MRERRHLLLQIRKGNKHHTHCRDYVHHAHQHLLMGLLQLSQRGKEGGRGVSSYNKGGATSTTPAAETAFITPTNTCACVCFNSVKVALTNV